MFRSPLDGTNELVLSLECKPKLLSFRGDVGAWRIFALSVQITLGLSLRKPTSASMIKTIASAVKIDVRSGNQVVLLSMLEKNPQSAEPFCADPSA